MTKRSPIHITIAQTNPLVGDIAGNMDLARQFISGCPARTDLAIFSELYVSGYPPEDLVLKASFLDAVESAVNAFAKTHEGPYVFLPCPWRAEGNVYNAVHLIGDGKILETRFKHHLPNYGVFDEKRVFVSGPMPDPVPFHGHNLGIMICEDSWYPDVSAHLKGQGADILVSINASPFETNKHDVRLATMRARVRETGLPLIYVNQIGGQDELVFDGASFVLNERGDVIHRAAEFSPDHLETIWDHTPTGHWISNSSELKTQAEGPALMYAALMTGLRDYVTKNGFPGVILGMSGGIDSALSAAIAADALGPDSVHCVMMPSVYTSKDSLDDAAECSRLIGALHDVIPIHKPVESIEGELAHHFTAETPDITHQNIQSRMRGMVLMAISNASGRMVLSTGNKSEMATGYATLYGDMCGGFNALKDVYKTDVYAMAKWRNENKPEHGLGPHGVVIPERIITKAPTAELKANQTDQDTLPPYEILDSILRCLIEEDLDTAAIIKRGHDAATVARVAAMLQRAEYKRRQAPPGVKITSRAFGRERRMPMTNGHID